MKVGVQEWVFGQNGMSNVSSNYLLVVGEIDRYHIVHFFYCIEYRRYEMSSLKKIKSMTVLSNCFKVITK